MIAKVAFPIALQGIFDYSIPEQFSTKIFPGVPVKVDLKNRKLWGVVVGMTETSSIPSLKPILEVKSAQWTASGQSIISLYEWMADYYQTDLGRVFKPLIKKRFAQLAPRKVTVYRFTGRIPGDVTKKQMLAIEKIQSMPDEVTRDALIKNYSLSSHQITVLTNNGVLEKSEKQVLREAPELSQKRADESAVLTQEQNAAVDVIWSGRSKDNKPYLLYGITGSGKTLVYIDLVQKTLASGRGAIILVPEISLTPQTIRRFRDALGSGIAVIHSRMSEGERRDSVEEIVSGNKRIVIGVRSAILVPMHDVGIIIVDEEHDGSYKQTDPEPRYHARDVAVMRGRLQNAVVVLGSATPSLESYHNAINGKYNLVRLQKRFGDAALPAVTVIDMSREHREKNWTFLSRCLHGKIRETLDLQRQVILLLNRRGFSVSLICSECGHTYVCPNCSVNLVYHRTDISLRCHQCGYREQAPRACGKCGGEQIKYTGTGIQKVEEFLRAQFPDARIIRMDQDSTRGKGNHIAILEAFAAREADILLGTQMVAKGLDFPGVRLVGVLAADIGLHFPDFRASEKTFQLLAQVAGRAGRKDNLGEVVIQTYYPGEPSLLCAQNHDFEAFYHHEIGERGNLCYPPFSRLVRIIMQGESESLVKSYIKEVKDAITAVQGDDLSVLGPSPAMLSRVRNVYRHTILIKSKQPKRLQKVIHLLRTEYRKLPKTVRLIVDVDPVNML